MRVPIWVAPPVDGFGVLEGRNSTLHWENSPMEHRGYARTGQMELDMPARGRSIPSEIALAYPGQRSKRPTTTPAGRHWWTTCRTAGTTASAENWSLPFRKQLPGKLLGRQAAGVPAPRSGIRKRRCRSPTKINELKQHVVPGSHRLGCLLHSTEQAHGAQTE